MLYMCCTCVRRNCHMSNGIIRTAILNTCNISLMALQNKYAHVQLFRIVLQLQTHFISYYSTWWCHWPMVSWRCHNSSKVPKRISTYKLPQKRQETSIQPSWKHGQPNVQSLTYIQPLSSPHQKSQEKGNEIECLT